jgi:hypothetical protein
MERDAEIYQNYLLACSLRMKVVCEKYGISLFRYKQIIATQKKLRGHG